MMKFITKICFLLTSISLYSQWAYNPSINTPLVISPNDPTNISVLGDKKDGGFIIWQDINSSYINNIFFIHFNKDGQVSFEADGIEVSPSVFNKLNPIATINQNDEVLILWKEIISQNREILRVQKVNSFGKRLWNDFGIQLEKVEGKITEFSISCNRNREAFIVMISKNPEKLDLTKTIYKINNSGELVSKLTLLRKSTGNIHDPQIISIDDQNFALSWIEAINNKSILKFNTFNISSKNYKEPLTISNEKENIIDYSLSKLEDNYYITWTVLSKNRRIYHQLVSSRGEKKWGQEGKLITTQKGSNYNPKYSFYNNQILVTWINEINNFDKNIYANFFDFNGEKIWDSKPLPIVELKGDQFGQQVVSDKKGGFIIAWIDKRDKNDFGNIYAQKITIDKKFLWDSAGVDIGNFPNSPKSYLNLISDKLGGAIAIFKDKRNDGCKIYGQKIFSSGTFSGQILDFKIEQIIDSVKISWYAINEPNAVEYEIYRKNNKASNWEKLSNLLKPTKNDINYYEYFDFPSIDGIIIYKLVQKIAGKESQQFFEKSIDYISNWDNYILYQNSPNPFSKKTNISFVIPFPQNVQIELFDFRLNLIKILVDDYFNAGKHSVELSADELSNGVYFYRIRAGSFIAVKKMVVDK